VPPEISRWFYEGVSSQDRRLLLYPAQGHSLLKEDGEVLDDIIAWLDTHRHGAQGPATAR